MIFFHILEVPDIHIHLFVLELLHHSHTIPVQAAYNQDTFRILWLLYILRKHSDSDFTACTCRAAIAVRYSIIAADRIVNHCAGLSGFVFCSADMPPSICSFITSCFFNKSLPVCRALPWVRFHHRISGICTCFESIDRYLPVFKKYRDFFIAGIQAQLHINSGNSRGISLHPRFVLSLLLWDSDIQLRFLPLLSGFRSVPIREYKL